MGIVARCVLQPGQRAGQSVQPFRLPGVKAVGVALGAGIATQPDGGGTTSTFGVSGGVKHNASGLSVNGSWAQAKATGQTQSYR